MKRRQPPERQRSSMSHADPFLWQRGPSWSAVRRARLDMGHLPDAVAKQAGEKDFAQALAATACLIVRRTCSFHYELDQMPRQPSSR